jgi:peroxiredoxin
MALTESYMLPLGTLAPDFLLPNVVSGKQSTLESLKGSKGTLVIFMCNHCPYVLHLMDALVSSVNSLAEKDINTIAISSNSIHSHPQDGPEEMMKLSLEKSFLFPYLYDETQEVAHLYRAACTPDFYLFDADTKLAYRGRYDSSRPGNEIYTTGEDLHKAAEMILLKKPITEIQFPSMGCNIKWHQGNNPKEHL